MTSSRPYAEHVFPDTEVAEGQDTYQRLLGGFQIGWREEKWCIWVSSKCWESWLRHSCCTERALPQWVLWVHFCFHSYSPTDRLTSALLDWPLSSHWHIVSINDTPFLYPHCHGWGRYPHGALYIMSPSWSRTLAATECYRVYLPWSAQLSPLLLPFWVIVCHSVSNKSIFTTPLNFYYEFQLLFFLHTLLQVWNKLFSFVCSEASFSFFRELSESSFLSSPN